MDTEFWNGFSPKTYQVRTHQLWEEDVDTAQWCSPKKETKCYPKGNRNESNNCWETHFIPYQPSFPHWPLLETQDWAIVASDSAQAFLIYVLNFDLNTSCDGQTNTPPGELFQWFGSLENQIFDVA